MKSIAFALSLAVAASASGGELYLLAQTNTDYTGPVVVSSIDTATGQLTPVVVTSLVPHQMAYMYAFAADPWKRNIYFVDQLQLFAVHLVTGTVDGPLLDPVLDFLAVDPKTGTLYGVGWGSAHVAVWAIDPEANTKTLIVETDTRSRWGVPAAFDTKRKRLFFVGRDDASLFVVDVQQASYRTLPVGLACSGYVFDEISDTLYATDDGQGDDLKIVDIDTNTGDRRIVLSTGLPKSAKARSAVIDSAHRTLYFNSVDGRLFSFDLRTRALTELPFPSRPEGVLLFLDGTTEIPLLGGWWMIVLLAALSAVAVLRLIAR